MDLPTNGFFDEMEKIAVAKFAQAKLRKLVEVLPQIGHGTESVSPFFNYFDLMLGRKKVGSMAALITPGKGAQVFQSEINPRFRGLGLGKKLYGEVMRMSPEGSLISDVSVSEAAQRVWRGMKKRKGYEFIETTLKNLKEYPTFSANITPEARY